MKKTLLILGGGKEQIPAIIRANKKNIRTIVFDKNPEAEGSRFADEFYPISTRDISGMINFLKNYSQKIDGVMTIASDIPHCVSAVGEFLGLKCIPKSVADICVNKLRMKEVLKKKKVNVPYFAKVESIENLKTFINSVGYPVVLKPIDNAGARGVLRITRDIDINWAFNYSKQFSYCKTLIVEKFLEGLQISTEGIMYNDKFYITGFTDRNYSKLEKTKPFMVEDGGDIPSILTETEKEIINKEFEKAVRALNINWGPAKGDMVLGNDGKAYVIEIAARLSGGNFCFDKVPLSTGVDIIDILIDMCIGDRIDVRKFRPTKNIATSQRYFFPRPGRIVKVKGIGEVKKMKNIYKIDFFVKIDDIVKKVISHPSRTGYVISCGKTRDEAIYWAEKAIKTVKFITN